MFNQQFKKAIKDIMKKGISSSPRGQNIKEILNYSLVLKNPIEIAVNYKSRKFNYKYQLAEFLRYMSGKLDVDFIGEFAKLWKDIAQDGKVNSNYGYLVFGKLNTDGLSQYNYVLQVLKKDRDTRQAIMFYNGMWNQVGIKTDFTCTSNTQIFIRDNKLNMISNMRSNDLFYGFSYDIIWFSLVLQSLLIDLKNFYPELELGKLYHNAGSLHIYERNYELSNQLLKQKGYNIQLRLKTSLRTLYNTLEITDLQSKLLTNKNKTQQYYKKLLSKYIDIKDHNG